MENKVEIWKSYPYIAGIEVSTLGRVRTLDRVVSNGKGTRLVKGRILKPGSDGNGYLKVGIQIDGKRTMKYVHRLVAETFIPNPDNLPQVNHLDCDRGNNNIENLEFCTISYNNKYREKYGISNAESLGRQLLAINLSTLEVLHFRSQGEASRAIGVDCRNVYNVLKGKRNKTHGFWFKEDDGSDIEIDKDKLKDIVAGMNFTRGVFALNLNTSEVSRFNSQSEASRELGVNRPNIYKVIKGKYKQTGGFFFVNADENADDAINRKLQEIGGNLN